MICGGSNITLEAYDHDTNFIGTNNLIDFTGQRVPEDKPIGLIKAKSNSVVLVEEDIKVIRSPNVFHFIRRK